MTAVQTAPAVAGYIPGTWSIDQSHSEVGFSIRHLMVSKVKGRFSEFSGTFVTGENPLESSVEASIVLSSIDTGNADREAALHGLRTDIATLGLSHIAEEADALWRHGVSLVLSGHTHGGQFFPFNLLIRFFQPIVAGLHRVGRTWLYVSRGTGYWGPPSRLGVRGEITVITLSLS